MAGKGGKMIKSEYFEKNNMDDSWVCSYCGSEEVSQSAWVNINTEKLVDFIDEDSYSCDICDEDAKPMKYFEWTEKIAKETMGNKEEYHRILDGSRM